MLVHLSLISLAQFGVNLQYPFMRIEALIRALWDVIFFSTCFYQLTFVVW